MKPIITFNAGSSSLKFAVFDGGLVQLLAGLRAHQQIRIAGRILCGR